MSEIYDIEFSVVKNSILKNSEDYIWANFWGQNFTLHDTI